MSMLPQGNKHPAISVLFLFLILMSCGETEPKQPTQKLDFGAFSIEVPATWRKITKQGLDSFVGGMATENSDTVSFDFGPYSDPLSEGGPYIMSREVFKARGSIDDSTILTLVDDYRLAKESDQYKKQNLLWDSVDGREAKIVYPRRAGTGVTGVYFDSAGTSKFGKDHLQVSGRNLNLEDQRQLLHAIRTIRFK